MPMIMDDGINVDDLFGESASLELGLPATAPTSNSTKGLAQRLDEMRLLGCCQKIAWSKQGCIAYISQDTLRVNLRHLECRPSDGKWVLSDDTPLHPVAEAHGGQPLVHLCWNEIGSELAVVDSSGRVSIYNIAISLNSLAGQRQAAFDPVDDAAQIVGMMWLNIQRSVHAFNVAAMVQGRRAYSPFRRRPIGPFHPAGKAALLCVTRSGIIRLLYQNPDNKWAEISAELKNASYSDRLLTHAAIVATQNGILIATYSACQKIYFYRVQINWTPPQWDPSQLKQAPNQFPVPSFRFMHSKVEAPCIVPSASRNGEATNDGLPSSTNPLYCLTRLDIVLAAHDNSAGMITNPWIIAVFSIPPHATPDHSQQQSPSSVIVRWQLESAPQVLHPKFDEVNAKKNNAQIKPKSVLRRQEDMYCDRYVTMIEQTEHGNVLAVTYGDSSVTFYDPKTMAVLNGTDDTNTLTSLAHAGFHYPPDSAGLHISFSPSGCNAVTLDGEGQAQLRVMEHSYGAENGLYDENKFSAAVASLTLAFCRGCGSEFNTDDILLILKRQASPDAQISFINEVYRALGVNCNYTQENDKLMSHQYLPKCLSVQAALGFIDKYKSRNFASNVPWTILQLRHASVLYALFLQYLKGGVQAEPPDADAIRILLGNTKWALDLLHYVLNDLLDLADDLESLLSDQEAFAQKLKTISSLPLIILLSSMSRAFLRFICRGLRGIQAGYATAPLTGDAGVYYAEIYRTLDTSPVRIDVYEKLLAGVDSTVRHVYHGAGFGDNERPGPEKELLVNGRIPPVLVTAVSTILRQTVPALKPDIDRMAIYMGDYSWLGLGSDRRAELYRRTRDVDIIKKIPFRSTASTGSDEAQSGKHNPSQVRRRCVRCCEIMCGAYPPRPQLSSRMMYKLGYVRYCICGGGWTLESDFHR
ncbi:mediator of RNA polymerase II transcription subunit 16 [Aspergillus minisclerotigenes]|uniref:Mediator of RNA polymerase II transcription subunit 16 n=1 Tax=Aspergillus minisclerotigenes TaxID=656917 RepID=A0A5N6IYW6_9EURO|nr:mediator of RNA polymerase II transcription subunit 16 [Aspergillus minisclerotigenes]